MKDVAEMTRILSDTPLARVVVSRHSAGYSDSASDVSTLKHLIWYDSRRGVYCPQCDGRSTLRRQGDEKTHSDCQDQVRDRETRRLRKLLTSVGYVEQEEERSRKSACVRHV